MRKNAFNFSEVMITIGAIGIVAALTMPGIVAHYHQKEYVTQLQRALSQFEQAMQIIMFRHECTDILCTGAFDGTASDAEWNKKFEKEITRSIKVIKTAQNGTAMEPQLDSAPLKPEKTKLSVQADWRSTAGFKFLPPDGVLYLVIPKNCESVPFPDLSTIKNICAEVTIDVNSIRRPNQYGRDIYKFIVAQNGHLYPMYGRDYSNATTGSASGNGYWRTNPELCAGEGLLHQAPNNVSGDGCAARIMEDGWKMTY